MTSKAKPTPEQFFKQKLDHFEKFILCSLIPASKDPTILQYYLSNLVTTDTATIQTWIKTQFVPNRDKLGEYMTVNSRNGISLS